MPHTEAVLKARKPEVEKERSGLAGLLKRRRRELSLGQVEAAAQMGVSEFTLIKWEAGRAPSDRWYPPIIRFLDAEPWDEPRTLGDHLRAERRRRGLSMARAAVLLEVDEGTWRRWECGAWKPTAPMRMRLIGFAPAVEQALLMGAVLGSTR